MNKYNSKFFKRNDVFFILYDMNDNLVCYFDNYKEACNIIGLRSNNGIARFNANSSNFIYVQKLGRLHKLYIFIDDFIA